MIPITLFFCNIWFTESNDLDCPNVQKHSTFHDKHTKTICLHTRFLRYTYVKVTTKNNLRVLKMFQIFQMFQEILAWGCQRIHSSSLLLRHIREMMMGEEKSETVVVTQNKLLLNNTVLTELCVSSFRGFMLVSSKGKTCKNSLFCLVFILTYTPYFPNSVQ